MREKRGQQRRSILLGLAALVLLGGAVAGRQLGVRPAHAQTPDDQSQLLQLAERLLTGYVPGPAGIGPSDLAQLYPGALAPDFPADLPLPPNSTLIGSEERPSAPLAPFTIYNGLPGPQATPSVQSGVHVDVVLDVPGSVDGLMSFYKQALASAGWAPPAASSTGLGGFVASNTVPQPTSYCRSSDHAQFSVLARTTSGGPLDVRLSFDTGFNPQCNPQALPSGVGVSVMPIGQGLLPALPAPQGVRVANGISIPGPTHVSSDAVATTDMSVPDLHSFYAGELSDAGWTQLDSGGGASLAWSTWSIPDHPDLQGFLYVRDGPASGQRSLHLEIGSTNPNASPFPGSPGVSVITNPISATPTPTATPAP